MITYAEHKEQSAREYLARVLHECEGNVSRAARMAGVHRTAFYQLLKRYGVKIERQSQSYDIARNHDM